MDHILLLKFLHVALAIVWLGGGMCFILLGLFAGRAAPAERLVPVMRHVAIYAPRVFIPGSLLVLATGLGLVFLGGYPWEAWTVLGLAGVAFTAVFGARVLGPLADRGVAEADRGDQAAAGSSARTLLRLARFDYVVQFAIVFLMVVKPAWDDLVPLAVVGGAVAAGAAVILPGGRGAWA